MDTTKKIEEAYKEGLISKSEALFHLNSIMVDCLCMITVVGRDLLRDENKASQHVLDVLNVKNDN